MAEPTYEGLLSLIARADDIERFAVGLKLGKRAQLAHGLSGTQKAVFAAALSWRLKRPFIVVSADWAEAVAMCEDLSTLLPRDRVVLFPPLDPLAQPEGRASSVARERLRALELLSEGRRGVDRAVPSLVVPAHALMHRLLSPGSFDSLFIEIATGLEVDMDRLLFRLVDAGYRRTEFVDNAGEFSVRGSLIDVFPPPRQMPVRIELDEERVSSLREFDPVTQRSWRRIDRVVLPPACEAGSEDHAPSSSLLCHVPRHALVLVDEAERVRAEYQAAYEVVPEERRAHQLPPETMWRALVDRAKVYLSSLGRTVPEVDLDATSRIGLAKSMGFLGRWADLVLELRRWRARKQSVVIFCSTPERKDALARAMLDEGIPASSSEGLSAEPGESGVYIVKGSLNEGFEAPGLRLVVLSESEVYGRPRKRRRPLFREPISSGLRVEDLKPGELVVHANHGIGRYLGIRSLEVSGTTRDYLFIQYAGTDALYVPTDQIHVIQKYAGPEDREPKISRLGTGEWSKLKNRVRASVRDMAQELLKLYAARQAVEGYAFPADSPWQAEFEASFPYEETPDQAESAAEIKKDMESARPMDRLLCGDVGYGKTEVAMRAAFKAVTDSKQVAVLVPTTILALQHHQTFKQRFAGYPVRVEVLTRMRSQKEQSECLDALKAGAVDIIIGTHRLLQPDVSFAALGLLVVDEEHRFGVAHKERIKQISHSVDVLTMSATPIPRTLYMALSGLRDMSVMQTPPEDRFPVQTFVTEYDEEIIKAALTRELSRGGQVYYVHNRVRTIQRAASKVSLLAPGARVGIAHGQMPEDHLEEVMVAFLEGKFDVLVCTTIIESGLDIANANTLIVEDADKLGLSQLYQLRGRVGRSNRLAYAYLTYREGKSLNDGGQKRLEAIRDFTDLGSGFKIAMRDLEIRGAGNLLGPEQHGFIAAVGFEMYCQMLQEAIAEAKGKPSTERPQVSVDLRVDAYIPSDYVPDSRQKIEIYKRMASVATLEDASDIEDELRDRFGPPPPPVQALVRIARTKVLAHQLGIKLIESQGKKAVFKWAGLPSVPANLGRVLGKEYRGKISLSPGRTRDMVLRCDGLTSWDMLAFVERTLEKLDEAGRHIARGQ